MVNSIQVAACTPIKYTVQFDQPGYVFSEDAGAVTMNLVLNRTNEGNTIRVYYDVHDGTARFGTDYMTSGSRYVEFVKGEQTKPVTVWIRNDDGNIPDKYFFINITQTSSGGVAFGENRNVTVTIKDTTPTVQFDRAGYQVNENGGSVKLNVTLSHPTCTNVIFYYKTVDGTAKDGVNFAGTANSTGTIPTGKISTSIELPIIDNSYYDGVRAFQVLISDSCRHGVVSTPNPATVTIIDDEARPTVQFNQTEYLAREGAGTATLNVTLSGKASDPVTVDYVMVDGTATYDEDYVPNAGSLTIPAGELHRTFTVDVKDDGKYSSPDEHFTVKLAGVSGLADIGSPSKAKVTLQEASARPTVQFNRSGYTVSEDEGKAILIVTLSGPVSSEVNVAFVTSDGTAVGGTNYTATGGFATFPAGSTADQQIEVPILDDSIFGGDTFFSVTLTAASAGVDVGSPATGKVTIEEDERTFTVQLYKGWNMISSPLVIEPFKASAIQSMTPVITQVMRYDTGSKQYQSFVIGSSPSFLDFDIKTDEGYLVYCNSDSTITFAGKLPVDRSVTLSPGWTMVGWSTLESSNMMYITEMLSGTQQIMTYDTNSKSYVAYIEGASPSFLSQGMGPGAGYLIYTSTAATLNYGGINDV